MFYAILDTNVLVSAMLKANSNPGEVVIESLQGKIIPILSPEILGEYTEVLHREKFKFDEQKVEVLLEGMKERALSFGLSDVNEVLPDPKDVVFYAVTMEARKCFDAFLVTGNIKHFPIKPYVVTPSEMIEILKQDLF